MTAQLTREAGDPHTVYNQMFNRLQLAMHAAGTVFQNSIEGQHTRAYWHQPSVMILELAPQL